MNPVDSVPKLVRELYGIVHRLEELFPGRRFTPDGHLVGSIGEVVAAHRYGLVLLPASAERHDASTEEGRLVQIKATQARTVGLRSEPDFLIVLRLDGDGSAREIYNGPGAAPWSHAGKMQKNGQRSISVSKLERLMGSVLPQERIPRLDHPEPEKRGARGHQ